MTKFNNGRPYHGSSEVENGKLKGATGETDYFYFFCPKCPDDEIVRILEYSEHIANKDNSYNTKTSSQAKYSFSLVFKFHCEKCGHTDFVKISNTGWQGDKHRSILNRET